ncbi:hypothetical protein ILYODFUR_014288 [Ilyodon furcidens]|uniref:Uncharacterized protein n=1 Tax=Ilyodon furcidens TaxID=33524 RepID=A0ABV0SMD3_9TELE
MFLQTGSNINILQWPGKNPNLKLIKYLWRELKISVKAARPSILKDFKLRPKSKIFVSSDERNILHVCHVPAWLVVKLQTGLLTASSQQLIFSCFSSGQFCGLHTLIFAPSRNSPT